MSLPLPHETQTGVQWDDKTEVSGPKKMTWYYKNRYMSSTVRTRTNPHSGFVQTLLKFGSGLSGSACLETLRTFFCVPQSKRSLSIWTLTNTVTETGNGGDESFLRPRSFSFPFHLEYPWSLKESTGTVCIQHVRG